MRIRKTCINWVQTGGTQAKIQKTERRGNTETDRETDKGDIGLSLRGLVLVLTLLQHLTDTPHYTHKKNTHTNTL